MNDGFSISEALKYGWTNTKANFGLLIGVGLFNIVVGIAASIPSNLVAPESLLSILFIIAAALVNYGLMMCFISICLKITDEGSARFGDLFEPLPLFFNFVGAMILMHIAIGIGLIFLIVPGIFILAILFFVPYVVVDEKRGILQSLARNMELTKGIRLQLFLFILVLIVVNVLGVLALGVGLLVTFPVTYLASAYVYRRVNSPQELGQSVQEP
jgi:uncharacterized membrane protein